MKKLVSVIILTYKNFNGIEKNLNSIFEQDYPNIEIVISDDCSENFDLNYIKKLLEKKSDNIKRIEIIKNIKNLGTVKNFNNAIKKSTGDYILPLSQDDSFYSKDTITKIVDSFGEYLVISGIRKVVSENGVEKGELPSVEEREILKDKKLYNYLILNGNLISGASTYYKREVFEKYDFFDENLFLLEDMPYYLKLMRNNESIKILDFSTIRYGDNGVSSFKNPLLRKDYTNLYFRESNEVKGYLRRYLKYRYKKFSANNDLKRKIINIQYLEAFLFKKFIKKVLYKYL